ncbi:MAG TPA: twin-arginine translocation signal domain-containing protein [Bacteroidales bacterium]|nr:twin-arginine translocation signal domain-containing protein [Bacteroidales bacterium]
MASHEVLNDYRYGLSRRKFLQLTTMSAVAVAAGCATNPVTGVSQFMLISEQDEIEIDRRYSPLQFSTDYGPIQDHALNNYVSGIGRALASKTHRPHMPYSFRVVNANYINAYAFPGGSIACTRGILLTLENEAELAALLGHEIGHVNARHTAEQMSKSQLSSMVVGGLSLLADRAAGMGQVASTLGGLSAGAFLARYSRESERQADALGMEYMVKSGYSPDGMVGLMDMLNEKNKSKPSAISLMFATHPMSDERYRSAVHSAATTYASSKNLPVNRERYMDKTAALRAMKGAIEDMQKGDEAMGSRNYRQAENHYRTALKRAPNDYAGLVSMAKCQLMQKDYSEGANYANRAKSVYPREAQGHHLSGFAALNLKKFDTAYRDFQTEQGLLPQNPTPIFFMGYSLEGMGRKADAAREYQRYLQHTRQGDYAQHAAQRLQQWGYAR